MLDYKNIKPCPFCGGDARVWRIPQNDEEEMKQHPKWKWNFPGMWVIGCETPMCPGNINSFGMVFVSRGSAIGKWNCRCKEDFEEYERS
jgi:hypothetical protein